MKFPRFVLGAAALLALAAPTTLPAQIASESLDLDVVAQIRAEGLENSQIEALAHYLTDVIGPRLTGSPGMRRANDWTVEKFEEWGLANAAVEPWGEFGRGWERVRYQGTILEPFSQPLNAQPVAWTAGTNGLIRGSAVVVPGGFDSLASFTGSLAGAFVMLREPSEITPEFEHRYRRTPVDSLWQPAVDRPSRRRGNGPINWDALMTRIADAQAMTIRFPNWSSRRSSTTRCTAASPRAGASRSRLTWRPGSTTTISCRTTRWPTSPAAIWPTSTS